MPLGFEERFSYSDVPCNFLHKTPDWTKYYSGLPLIGYEAIYGYRSGKRSKNMSTQGSYSTSVIKGRDLRSQILARKQFLENFINSSFSPTNGAPSAFSLTDDGHPFATYKVSVNAPYATVYRKLGTSSIDSHVMLNRGAMPYPDVNDPLGNAVRTTNTHAMAKQTYFAWPSRLYASGGLAPAAQQIYTNSLKQTLGSGLIANTNPWAAKADLAVTVLELLTGNLPRILSRIGDRVARIHIDWKLETGRELRKHTNPGNEWLSYHFGWAPLVQDIMAAVEILYKLHILLYTSNESRRHRGGDLGTWGRVNNNSTDSSDRQLVFESPLSELPGSPQWKDLVGTSTLHSASDVPFGVGSWSRSVLVHADYRFAARFHSGAVPNSAENGHIDKAFDLLGLDITPATLWNLAPWTWLLDWFSNIGTVAQNLSDLDWSNVLLDYAYLTVKVKTSATVSATLPKSWTANFVFTNRTPFISHTYVTEEKIREQASPYGFSVGWNGLSPFQLSILAALGMTRGR